MGLAQQAVEEIPGGLAAGGAQPQIGGVLAAEDGKARLAQALAQAPRIFHVVGNLRFGLPTAFGAEHGGGGALHDVGDAVELRRLPPRPEIAQRNEVARRCAAFAGGRHHAIGAAQAGETRAL